MAKCQAFKMQHQTCCVGITPNRQIVLAGSRQLLKVMNIRPENDYWFQTKKVLQKHKGPKGQLKLLSLTTFSCNRNNKVGIATNDLNNSVYIYDLGESLKHQLYLDKVLKDNYAKKMEWVSQDTFTVMSDTELLQFDTRSQQITMNLQIHQNERFSDYKYNHTNNNLIAFSTDSETINVYDLRNLSQAVASKENFKTPMNRSIPVQWSPDGSMIANGFQYKVRIWDLNGSQLQLFDQLPCAQQITKMKWMNVKDEYIFIVSQQKPARLSKYDLRDPNKYIGQYVMSTIYNSFLYDWTMDKQEELIVSTFGQFNAPKTTQVTAQFSENILDAWSGKYNYSVQFDTNNNILFPTKQWYNKKIIHSSASILTERQTSSIVINDHLYLDEFNRSKLVSNQIKKQQRIQKKNRKNLKKKISQQLGSLKKFQEQPPQLRGKSLSQDKSFLQSKRDKSYTKLQKNKSGDNKSVKRSIKSMSQLSSSDDQCLLEVSPQRYILSKKQQILYLINNYLIDISTHKIQTVIQHNSDVACRLNKTLCMEFWIILFSLAFPREQEQFEIEDIYQTEKPCEIIINNNKIVAVWEQEPRKQTEEEKIEQIRKLIQKLVDQNQLQTAVLGATVLRKINQKLVDQTYFYQLLAQYKLILKALGFSVRSIELSHYIYMAQFDTGYMIEYKTDVRCSFCRKKLDNCACGMSCIFCRQSLTDGFITVCKICGHSGHTKQYQQWFIKDKNTFCPYQCGHQCFNDRSFEMKLKKYESK